MANENHDEKGRFATGSGSGRSKLGRGQAAGESREMHRERLKEQIKQRTIRQYEKQIAEFKDLAKVQMGRGARGAAGVQHSTAAARANLNSARMYTQLLKTLR